MTHPRIAALFALLLAPFAAAAQPTHRSLPNTGRIHALVLFIDYSDDTTRPRHGFWRVGETPQWLASCIDPSPERPTGEKINISSYLRAMSLGGLEVSGDAYYRQAPKPLWRYRASIRNDGSPEPERQGRSAPWYTIRDVIRELAPTIDMGRYDRWTIRTDSLGNATVVEGPDGEVDLMFVAFRDWYARRDTIGFRFMAWLSRSDTFVMESGPPIVISNTSVVLNAAFYFPAVLNVLLYNVGRFYGLGSQYTAGMWAMMFGTESVSALMNGPERERVGWGRMIDVYRDTVVTIPDLASTGVACRINLPYRGAAFILENHQALPQPGVTSALDQSPLTYDVVDRSSGGAPGLYIVRNSYGELQPLPADGTWRWRTHSWVTASWSTTQQIPVYERVALDRVYGLSDRDLVPYQATPDGVTTGIEPVFAWIDPSTGAISTGDRPLVWGDGSDRFTADGANVFSRWSSPSSLVRTHTSDTSFVEEHCTVEVLDDRDGSITVRVRFTDQLAGPPSRPLGVRAHWSDSGAATPIVTWPASIEPDVAVVDAPGGHYEIWRSLEDRAGRRLHDWVRIGEVDAAVTEFADTSYAGLAIRQVPFHLLPIPVYRIRVVDTSGMASNLSQPFALMRGVTALVAADTTRRIWILPNPIRSSGTILYSVPEDGHASLTVHDATGREVFAQYGMHVRGDYSIAFDAPAEGAYVVRLRSGSTDAQERIIVVR